MADAVITLALRTLHSNFRGELRYDERQQRVKYIIAPGNGKLVVPVHADILEAIDTVLFVPEERDGAMEIMLTLAPLTQESSDEALADRWRTYHGEPEDPLWAACTIEAARHGEFVIDGEALMQPNPLGNDEPKLCKLLNSASKEALTAIVYAVANRQVESPLAVGVDPFGVDVRARFEIVRLEPPTPDLFASGDDARRTIDAWIAAAGGGR